jgi:hypothetical protein
VTPIEVGGGLVSDWAPTTGFVLIKASLASVAFACVSIKRLVADRLGFFSFSLDTGKRRFLGRRRL